MTKFRLRTLVVPLVAAAAAGCVGDRIVAPAEMRGGVLTDWYAHKTLYTYGRDPQIRRAAHATPGAR